MKINSIVTFALMLAPLFSWADKMGPNGDKFYEAAASFEGACRNKNVCRAPYAREVAFSLEIPSHSLPPEVLQGLQDVAHYQAQIWGDTILEGDYVAAGDTRLDHVEAYYRNSELLGYKIQYSEKAWDTADCAYDGSRESLVTCSEGRISETSYVSSDLNTFFSDEEQFAQFLNLY